MARMVYAISPNGKLIGKVDRRTDEERLDAAEKIEKLMVKLGAADPQMCAAARDGFAQLPTEYVSVLVVAAARSFDLFLAVSCGGWEEASSLLGQMAIHAGRGEPADAYRHIAVILRIIESNHLEDLAREQVRSERVTSMIGAAA